jgi:hypothetical protein
MPAKDRTDDVDTLLSEQQVQGSLSVPAFMVLGLLRDHS